jgi:replicative DNA helicase
MEAQIKAVQNNQESVIKRTDLFNLEAEQVILGSIIINNEYSHRISEFLMPEHFYDPAHQKIYTQILHNINKVNIIANEVTLKQFFNNDETISSLGGALYLSTLLSKATGIIDITDYAHLVYDLALKRELVIIGEDIVNNTYKTDDQTSAQEQVEMAEGSLFNLVHQGSSNSDFKNISHALKETLERTLIAKQREGNISGVSSGLDDLDQILGGMQNSDLIILAGRPSMGKTALAINVAVNACKAMNVDSEDKKAVGFFSLEMSADQLSARILSMETSINATKFRTGDVNEEEWQAITQRSAEIAEMPFFIDDTPALSIAAIRTRTRRLIRKHNLGFLLIDYLQLIRGSSKRSEQNRVQEISEITQGLKAIAKEFNIPVVALSQLSRAVEQRDDKRPQLSDLRESGSIEQDADVVAFIYRESYYEERKRPDEEEADKFSLWKEKMNKIRNVSEVIIAKQRNGPIGSIGLYFDAEFTRFNNLDTNH